MDKPINVFIARRYAEYTNAIKETISPHNCSIFLTDSKLRPEIECNTKATISIILAHECISDRETQSEWLEKITNKISKNSDNVLFLLYCVDMDKSMQYYNNNDKISIIFMNETIDDDHNISNIKQEITKYFNLKKYKMIL